MVDIGSNDGVFLKPLNLNSIRAIGVEPAKNLSEYSNSQGLETINSYFEEETVTKIIRDYGKADIITAFNVFAHGDGLREIVLNAFNLLNIVPAKSETITINPVPMKPSMPKKLDHLAISSKYDFDPFVRASFSSNIPPKSCSVSILS